MAKKQLKSTVKAESPVKNKMPKWVGCCLVAAIVFAVLVILLFVLMFSGFFMYGDALNKAGFRFNPQKNSISLTDPKTGEQVSVGQQATLPSNFPPIPVYPGSKLVVVLTSAKNPSATFASVDKPEVIYAWYRKELPKKGWTVNPERGFVIEFENSAYKGTLITAGVEKNTTISITFEKK